jgi:hypothetical protein
MHDTMHIVHSSSRNLNFEGLGAVNDAPYGVAQLGAGTHSCTCAQLHQPSTCSLVVMQHILQTSRKARAQDNVIIYAIT